MADSAHAVGALEWGVKASFRAYVAGVGGRIDISDGAAEAVHAYRFPFAASDDATVLKFTGAVTFAAHDGLLALTIRNPWITYAAEKVDLTIEGADGGRIPLASGPRTLATAAEIAPLALVESACVLFDFTYPPDTPLDPARLVGS
jgi:hypothetical protein